jgi:Ca-activated chloride channel family protein
VSLFRVLARTGRRLAGIAAAILILFGVGVDGVGGDTPLSVRLTSPLGRTGTPGAVRIVARIQPASGATIGPVRFLIDGTLYKTKDDGPPYVVEWVDDNPFERREITVEVEDSAGHAARDTVVLEPFEVSDTTEVFSVVLDAAVRDKTGRFIAGLAPEHFQVMEEDVSQKPQLVSQESVPAMFVLLVDSSNSMAHNFDFVRQAAGRLLKYLKPHDTAIVAPFTKTLGAITGPTNDRETILGAIGTTQAGGGTAIFDSLKQVADRIAPEPGRHAIILITDGYDENSQDTFDDAVEAVKRARATVYAVGIGGIAGLSSKGELQIKKLAAETGGRVFIPRIDELGQVYDQLAADAQTRYVISFTPTNQVQDGSFRHVTVRAVTARGDEYRVTTRDGYFAPKAPPVKPLLEFTVMDDRQELIDVTRDDLMVVEDGVEQKIDTFQIAVDPVQIVLTLDESGSMRLAVEAMKNAARDFVRALEPEDPLALITFADKVQFAHDLTTVRDWSFDAIEKYQAVGGTALYDALYASILRLKFVKGRRAVVILTDGRDENNPGTGPGSGHTLADVLARLKEVDAAIYPIGLGPRVDAAMLEKLAEISGGRAYFPQDASALAEQYRGIIENLRRRYVLGYASTNPKRDGAWRTVEIKPREGTLRVRSRGGYFAPER